MIKIKNPVVFNDPNCPYLCPPFTVYDKKLIEFLEIIPIDWQDEPGNSKRDLAFKLRNFLNTFGKYNIRWMSGTMGDYCTGGFKLLFKGEPKDSHPAYLINNDIDYVYIFQITQGENKGLICIQYLNPSKLKKDGYASSQ